MLLLYSNTFASPAEPFLAFGFEHDRTSLNPSLKNHKWEEKNKTKQKTGHNTFLPLHKIKYLVSCLGYFNLETSPYENPANEEHWNTDYNELAALLSGRDCNGYMICYCVFLTFQGWKLLRRMIWGNCPQRNVCSGYYICTPTKYKYSYRSRPMKQAVTHNDAFFGTSTNKIGDFVINITAVSYHRHIAGLSCFLHFDVSN